MTTKRRFRSRPRGRAQPTKWENIITNHVHVVAASQVFTQMTPAPLLVTGSGTAVLKRMIMHVDINPAAGVGIGEIDSVGMGMTVVTQEAFEVIAQLPDPLSDFEHSWYWWAQRFIPVQEPSAMHTEFDVDIRTMRKLRNGYGLALISETPLNPSALTVSFSARMLWSVTP